MYWIVKRQLRGEVRDQLGRRHSRSLRHQCSQILWMASSLPCKGSHWLCSPSQGLQVAPGELLSASCPGLFEGWLLESLQKRNSLHQTASQIIAEMHYNTCMPKWHCQEQNSDLPSNEGPAVAFMPVKVSQSGCKSETNDRGSLKMTAQLCHGLICCRFSRLAQRKEGRWRLRWRWQWQWRKLCQSWWGTRWSSFFRSQDSYASCHLLCMQEASSFMHHQVLWFKDWIVLLRGIYGPCLAVVLSVVLVLASTACRSH